MDDRRRFFRFDTPLNLEYTSRNNEAKGQTKIRNISREGVAFATAHKLDKDEPIKMRLDIPGDDFPVFAQGTVVWVATQRKSRKDNFEVGVKLDSITRADRGRVLEYAYHQWLKIKNMGRKG